MQLFCFALPTLKQTHDAVETLFYILSLLLAYRGLETWKKELTGKNQYELAQKILTSAFKIRQAVVASYTKLLAREELTNNDDSNSFLNEETFKSVMHYRNRFQTAFAERDNLYPLMLEAEALFGNGARQQIQKLIHKVDELWATIETMATLKDQSIDRRDPIYRQCTNILHGLHKGLRDDPLFNDGGFRRDFESALNDIEITFSPMLR